MSTKNSKTSAILWFRRDLRLADNPALAAAIAQGAPIIPLFIDESGESGTRAIGGASKWWRGASLSRLDESLRAVGSRLILRHGRADDVLGDVLTETGAGFVFHNLRRDPAGSAEDLAIAARLRARGVGIETGDANYLHDPHHLRTGAGGGFKVFTPFWTRLREVYRPPDVLPAPKRLNAPERWPTSLSLKTLQVTDGWTKSIAGAWEPGEAGARNRLAAFTDAVPDYGTARDRPDLDGTSRLSPHLAWGEISVHEIWRRLTRAHGDAAMPFLREIAWRDFNMHLLHGFPELSWQPIQAKFAAFPAKNDPARLKAWQRGLTGYPIVDAGMRQLWQTGWMHNRVRMIVGSFLVKDLLLPWQRGEEWFWDTLVDADLAQNGGNWQWIAGCGADAAPFFRVFNPILQAEKFDPKGRYVRQWIPELAKLPEDVIHEPWKAGIRLGKGYPLPIVDHAKARQIALAAYKRISSDGKGSDEPTLL